MGTGRGIADITPLTLLDFPNKVACIFWLGGCNLFCQYCYNVSLVQNAVPGTGGRTDYLNFLRDRVGFLDGVVLSGGECTLCPDLIPICREIRQLGFAIKIDTNGTRPSVVKSLVEEGLCDYIALDYKAPAEQYGAVTGRPGLFPFFSRTLDYLIASKIPFEVRTTVHPDLLTEDHVNTIIRDLTKRGYEGNYFVQNFYQTTQTLNSLPTPDRPFDRSRVDSSSLPVQFRNFDLGNGRN